MTQTPITFQDNQTITLRKEKYVNIDVCTEKIIESWKHSIFSFEWFHANGLVKDREEMSEAEMQKRLRIEEAIQTGQILSKPVLGIGIQDHIEIGSGRAEFLTAYTHGLKEIPVHIPKSNESDFKDFLS